MISRKLLLCFTLASFILQTLAFAQTETTSLGTWTKLTDYELQLLESNNYELLQEAIQNRLMLESSPIMNLALDEENDSSTTTNDDTDSTPSPTPETSEEPTLEPTDEPEQDNEFRFDDITVDNSNMLVDVYQQTTTGSTRIYHGALSGYDNGYWDHFDFSRFGTVGFFNWNGTSQLGVSIIPCTCADDDVDDSIDDNDDSNDDLDNITQQSSMGNHSFMMGLNSIENDSEDDNEGDNIVPTNWSDASIRVMYHTIDYDLTNSDCLVQNEQCSIYYLVRNNTYVDQTINLLFTTYDKDGRFLDFVNAPYVITANSSTGFCYITTMHSNVMFANIAMFDSLGNLKPVTQNLKLTNYQKQVAATTGDEYEQSKSIYKNVIEPTIDRIDLKVLNITTGKYRLTLNPKNCTYDNRASNTFFMWNSLEGVFTNQVNHPDGTINIDFHANRGTGDRDVTLDIGFGDGLGNLTHKYLSLKGNDEV